MDTKSWHSIEFAYPASVPTMISPEEKKYLYWLGANQWKNRGKVVEIGSWLGGSTVCLAAGMESTEQECIKALVVFDNYIWRDFMGDRHGLELGQGESFMPAFLEFTKKYSETIDAHRRRLPDEKIVGDVIIESRRGSGSVVDSEEEVAVFDGLPDESKIEILFVDGAKSWAGIRHLLLTLEHNLEPGYSLLVCQDFKYWSNYWVPLMMAKIVDCLEPVHNILGATTVTFRVTQKLDRSFLESLPAHINKLDATDCIESIETAAKLLEDYRDPFGASCVRLGKTSLYIHHEMSEQATDNFIQIQKNWSSKWKGIQLERARRYLQQQTGTVTPRPFRLTADRAFKFAVGKLRRIFKQSVSRGKG